MPPAFTTIYSPGPNWDGDKILEEQTGFKEQVLWWKGHDRQGRLKMLGVILERPDERPKATVVVWYCDNLAEAVAYAAASPLVVAGRLTAATTPGEPSPCGRPN